MRIKTFDEYGLVTEASTYGKTNICFLLKDVESAEEFFKEFEIEYTNKLKIPKPKQIFGAVPYVMQYTFDNSKREVRVEDTLKSYSEFEWFANN